MECAVADAITDATVVSNIAEETDVGVFYNRFDLEHSTGSGDTSDTICSEKDVTKGMPLI